MWKAAVILVSSLTIVTACDDNLEVEVDAQQSALEGKKDLPRLAVTADQLCTDVTVPTAQGETLTGTRRCESTAPNCEAIGDTDCTMMDADLYGVHDPDLTPENIRAGVELGEEGGQAAATAPVCDQDGQQGCLAQDNFVAVDTSAVAAKTIAGQTLAGVAGSYDPGYPARENVLETETVNGEAGLLKPCTQAGESACIPSANYVPVTTAQLDPTIIRRSVTIGGVTGTYDGLYSDCTADGEFNCLTTANLVALLPSDVDATKVRSQIKIAGKSGTLAEAPVACNAALKANCVTTTGFPSADYDLLTASNIKVGVQLQGFSAGILGEYPSIAHPLVGAQANVTDLTTTNFNTRMASADTFEYWDSTGQHHTNAGDDDLAAANLVDTVTLFGVSGTVAKSPAACGDSDEVECVTSTTHPSYDKSLLVAGNIKNNVQIHQGATQVTGAWPSAQHPLSGDTGDDDLSQANFNQVVSSGTAFDYWNAEGVRVGGTGSSTLLSANIVPGATIFGVQGSGALRPANCGDGDTTGCVTTTSHPSYLAASFPAHHIKNGTTIGLVTGEYPSADHPLADNSATADLKGNTFAAQVTSVANAPFEYWDNTGTRHTGAGNGLLSGLHLRDGVNVFGKVGTITPRGNDCTAAEQNGCVATEDFPSYNPATLTADVLKTGVTVLGVTGTYPSATNPLPDDDPNIANVGDFDDFKAALASGDKFEFWDYQGRRVVKQGDTDLVAGNIKDGVTLFDVDGSMIPRPSDCTAGNRDSCVATSRYKSVDTVNVLTPGVLKKGVVLGGVTGDYPSATYPLAGALPARHDLEGGASFGTAITSGHSIEFFTSFGGYQALATHDLTPADVKDGVTLFGVEGTTPEAPAPCASNLVTGCLTSTNFPSYQSGAITAAELKTGTSIGGVVGGYPSSSHPLADASAGRADLNSATFNAKIKSGAEFEYWDADGNHYVENGSAAIAPENIEENASIFAVQGTMKTGNVVVDASKVRAGIEIGNQTGSLKLSCNNTGSSKTNTTDDYNDGNGMPTGEPFGSEQSCRTGVFVDQREGGVDCGVGFTCVYKDTITGLSWRSSKANSENINFQGAANFCTSFGGSWRVPTHKEYVTAYVHGLRNLTFGNGGLYPGTGWWMWTSTYYSKNTDMRIQVELGTLKHRYNLVGNNPANKTLCVK